jgi:hypothetical protein
VYELELTAAEVKKSTRCFHSIIIFYEHSQKAFNSKGISMILCSYLVSHFLSEYLDDFDPFGDLEFLVDGCVSTWSMAFDSMSRGEDVGFSNVPGGVEVALFVLNSTLPDFFCEFIISVTILSN